MKARAIRPRLYTFQSNVLAYLHTT